MRLHRLAAVGFLVVAWPCQDPEDRVPPPGGTGAGRDGEAPVGAGKVNDHGSKLRSAWFLSGCLERQGSDRVLPTTRFVVRLPRG